MDILFAEYEQYQLEWMIAHGHTLAELIEELDRYSTDCDDMPIEDVFAEWVDNVGFGGEIWACYDEWYENERRLENE